MTGKQLFVGMLFMASIAMLDLSRMTMPSSIERIFLDGLTGILWYVFLSAMFKRSREP